MRERESMLLLFRSGRRQLRLVWLGGRDKSLEIFCLLCGKGSFGGIGKRSLDDQLPLINSLGKGWELCS